MFPDDWRGNPVALREVEIDMSETTETVKYSKSLFGDVGGQPLRIPIIGVCGVKGSGKTIAGLSLDPENTTVVDNEDSSASYNLPLKKRYSLYDEVHAKAANGIPSPIECWLWFEDVISNIDSRVLFVDPITDLQSGVVEWVKANPEKFGRTKAQYDKASGLLWADVKSHLKMTLGRLSRRVECFIFTAHMGTIWRGGSPVEGKMKAKGVDTFYELASLYLHLRRDVNPKDGKVPAMPVASIVPPLGKSRLAHTTMVDGELKVLPILPPQVKDFSWKRLREYVAKPPNYDSLKAGERLEMRPLTDDEKLQIQASIAADNVVAEELRNGRLDSAAIAAQRNADARTSASATATQAAVKDEGSVTKTTESWKDANLSLADRVAVIKGQMKSLSLTKEAMVKAIEKRGGVGAKLAGLDIDQLCNLHAALWSKLTQADMGNDAKKKKH